MHFSLSVQVPVNVYINVSSMKAGLCSLAVVLTQRVSTVHFCKSISDQSLLVRETRVLLYWLCISQWAGMGGLASAEDRHIDE